MTAAAQVWTSWYKVRANAFEAAQRDARGGARGQVSGRVLSGAGALEQCSEGEYLGAGEGG